MFKSKANQLLASGGSKQAAEQKVSARPLPQPSNETQKVVLPPAQHLAGSHS